MNMQTLKVGDIIQKTDQQRTHVGGRWPHVWIPVSPHLVGKPLLPGDLMHLHFRRPPQ